MLTSLVQKYLGSIIRNAMTATAVYLIAHGVITQEQSGVLVSSPLIETLAAIVLWAAALLLSLAQKRTQEAVARTALRASPKTPMADVVTLVKQGFGVPMSFLGKVLGIALLVLLPVVASAQTAPPPKPSAPPSIAGCASTDWTWNATAGQWNPVCDPTPTQLKPGVLPDMGPFCGRSDWEWDPDAGRYVAVCVQKSRLYQSILVGAATTTGMSVVQQGVALAQGQIDSADPTLKPWASKPWVMGAIASAETIAPMFLTEDWFRRHPTLSGTIHTVLLLYRGGAIAYVAFHAR